MTARALMPDYLRLIALFGIVVVNVQAMAYPTLEGFESAGDPSALDTVVIWLVDGLAYLKSYGLFSFMFGVGLAFQMAAADRANLPFAQLYRNRLLALGLFGLLHGVFFFLYDILLLYALMGALLYLMRDWPVRRLVWAAVALILGQLLIELAFFLLPDEDDPLAEIEPLVMQAGSIADVIELRATTYVGVYPLVLVFQAPSALGWFALGLAAFKAGLIDTPDHPLWGKARRLCVPLGLGLSLLAAALTTWGPYDLAGTILLSAIAPVATLGYLGLIAAIARPPGPLLARILQAGASSLTIYLGQSILMAGIIFTPFGLGLWGELGVAATTAIALAVTCTLIAALIVWRLVFAQGPFEAALRALTRLGVSRP